MSTPIGTARDITLRALDTLNSVDVIAAEDTRTIRRLMEIHGISVRGRPILPYHDHNGAEMRPKLLRALADGKSVAYASDAGTPMVADPGFTLARAAIADGHDVFSVPGASAAVAALTVSGLPTDRFFFAGFPPTAEGQLRSFLGDLAEVDATLILYETPRRLKRFLTVASDVLGEERPAAVCRELTKKFEDVRRMPLGALAEAADDMVLKGESVVVIDRGAPTGLSEAEVKRRLIEAMQNQSFKDAVREVTQSSGLPRRDVYQLGLALRDKEGEA